MVSAGDRSAFVDFQFDLYRNKALWIPPMKKDEFSALDPVLNPAYSFCDAAFWMVMKDGKAAGRIGAIINRAYNEKTGKSYGRINRIEFIDDAAVFDLLIRTAVDWLSSKGAKIVHGPLGFSNLDTQGLLIEGFDHMPSIASVYHMPYYQAHFERAGFMKENDWLEFRLKLSTQAVDKASRGMELLKKRYGFNIVEVSSRSELKKYTPRIFEILNASFTELPYVAKLDEGMVRLYSKKYFDILVPEFVTMVEKDGVVIGFFIGLPSLSEAMIKARGRLWPFGIFHIMKALKKPSVIDMLLTGVLPEFQSSGVAVLLIGELQKRMTRRGIDTMETTGVFESNYNVISNWKNYDHIQHKRRRCYYKEIA